MPSNSMSKNASQTSRNNEIFITQKQFDIFSSMILSLDVKNETDVDFTKMACSQ